MKNSVSFITFNKGQKGKITFIKAGFRAKKRLFDLGLTEGTVIQMSRKALFNGPIEIIVKQSKIAIGWGLAAKLIVKPLKNKNVNSKMVKR